MRGHDGQLSSADSPSGPSSGRPDTTLFLAPSVALLLLWMIIPLVLTVWFSLQRFNLLRPSVRDFVGLHNYQSLAGSSVLWIAIANTLVLVTSVLAITVVLGTSLAVLLNQEFPGRTITRLMMIAPFFMMPTVSALLWKNLLLHPVSGVVAAVTGTLGLAPIDWFGDWPMVSIVIIVSWQWLPFAILILMTSLQSLEEEQLEAARLDGAGPLGNFAFIVLPHLKRPITVLIMVETMFLLAVFAEIFVTTSGGPGLATTNLTYLVYIRALMEYDVGSASAGGVIAVILANAVAVFLVRSIASSFDLEGQTS